MNPLEIRIEASRTLRMVACFPAELLSGASLLSKGSIGVNCLCQKKIWKHDLKSMQWLVASFFWKIWKSSWIWILISNTVENHKTFENTNQMQLHVNPQTLQLHLQPLQRSTATPEAFLWLHLLPKILQGRSSFVFGLQFANEQFTLESKLGLKCCFSYAKFA